MSLPTPPAGTLDRDQPWYRGRISDAQWDRLKAKLTGGTDAGGTSYSKIIDCSSSEADKIISNMKKDPRGYPQINNPGGAEGYENMYNYYTFLKDAYLYDEPKPEPEEIPVEVEQKTVDEPIVIKIEAPFEPAPEAPKLSAPKRVRLPRRSGLMKARPIGPAKKSSAERMSEAFDKNLLGPLVDSIQNPPAPAPPRQRKQKETLAKVKRSVKPKSRFKETNNVKPLENTSLFVFNKVKSAFGRAADARRMAQEQGLPEQEKRFYIKRALGFEFGGDAIARTRGTFSKSPDATLDPSLTKQQRYTQGLFGTRTIRPPAKTKDTSGNIDTITKKISDLEKQFDNLIEIKKISSDSKESTGDLSKTLDDLKNALKKGSKHQKDINASKKKLLDLEAKAADAAQADVEEAELDKTQDLSDFVKNAKKKEKEEEEGKSKDDGGGGGGFRRWLKNFRRTAGKWWRRIKNPGKTWKAIKRLTKQKLKKIPGVKGLNNWMKRNKPFQGLRNMFRGNKAAGAAKTADAAADATKAVRTADAAGDAAKAGGIFSRLSRFAGPLKGLTRNPLVRAGGRFGGRALPLIGAVSAAATAKDRYEKMNDPEFQKMVQEKKKRGEILTEEEMYSNSMGVGIAALSGIPIAGIPALLAEMAVGSKPMQERAYRLEEERKNRVGNVLEGIGVSSEGPRSVMPSDGSIPQLVQGSDNRNIFQKMMDGYQNWIYGTEKMSEGGTVKLAGGGVNAMIGEAGPEMLLRAGEGGMNPLQSLAPIIASLREVTKRAGTWADPVENMVRQITDPIAKSLKLPVVPMNVDIDKEVDKSKTKKVTRKKGLLSKLMNFLKGGGNEEEKAADIALDSENGVTGIAGNFSGGAKGVLDLIASVEAPDYDTFNQSRGRTEGKATEKTIAWLAANAQGAIGRYQHMPQFILKRAQDYGIPTNAVFTPEVQDLMTVRQMEAEHGLKEFLSGELSAEEFGGRLAATWRGLPQGPKNAARLGGTADSTYNDGTDNKAGMLWADAVASLKSIRAGGNTSAPGAPGVPGAPPRGSSNISIVGDSVAQGFVLSGANRGGRNNAVQGRNPQQVEAALKSTVRRGNTGHVVLSTGLSNNTGMMSDVKDQMAYLQSQNISFTVLPLASTVQNSAALNNQLRNLAPQYGGRYASQVQGFAVAPDGYNAHMADPMAEYRKLQLGGS